MQRRRHRTLPLALAALVMTGCADRAAHDRAVLEAEQARRANLEKDRQIQALSWQITHLWQEAQAAHQRDQAALRDLLARVQQLGAANAELSERVKAQEARLAAPPDDKGRPGALRPEDLRRIEAMLAARNAQLGEALARIEKLLRERDGRAGGRIKAAAENDLENPWGFGHRK